MTMKTVAAIHLIGPAPRRGIETTGNPPWIKRAFKTTFEYALPTFVIDQKSIALKFSETNGQSSFPLWRRQ